MKITPLILFLILLFVLVISVLFSKYLPLFNGKEGMIGFNGDKKPLDESFIPQYSTDIQNHLLVKLYDNIYFDGKNGNLIEVDESVPEPTAPTATTTPASTTKPTTTIPASTTKPATTIPASTTKPTTTIPASTTAPATTTIPASTTGPATTTISATTIPASTTKPATTTTTIKPEGFEGSKDSKPNIKKIYVLERGQTDPKQYSVDGDSTSSKITEVKSLYTNTVYDTQCKNTDKYKVIYIPWDKRTYIHILNMTSKSHVGSFMFGKDVPNIFIDYKLSNITPASNTNDSDINNNKYIKLPKYDPKISIYQINKSTFFDVRNGYLIVNPTTPSGDVSVPNVYNRSGDSNSITIPPSDKLKLDNKMGFTSWIQKDAVNNTILYMTESDKTLITILKQGTSNKFSINLGNVVLFTKDGVDINSISDPTPTESTEDDVEDDLSGNLEITGPQTSEYYKWLAYWNTMATPTTISDDYLLKTQIVPPVCPSCATCPTCPRDGSTCTNCGGYGGSGTIDNTKSSVISGDNQYERSRNVLSNTVNASGNLLNTTVNTAGDVLKNTGSTASDLLKTTGSTASDLLKSTGSGATDLLKSTGSGATDLLKSTGSGATDLLKSTGSGAVNLLGSAGSGVKGLLVPNNQGYNQGYNQPQFQVQGQVQGQPQFQGQGQPPMPNGGYSYNGALPNKPSTPFIPITADFSAFGK
jgi:hypothetical protein